jgi:glycosyl transferase family 25
MSNNSKNKNKNSRKSNSRKSNSRNSNSRTNNSNYVKNSKKNIVPTSFINDISHIIYVNLDSRTDRNKRILNELSIFDPNKITRVSAVNNVNNPRKGCILSHLKALKLAREKDYPNVLILEDDIVWTENVVKGYEVFKKLLNNPYDVIMLGGTSARFNPTTFALDFAYGTHAYLVNKSYYNTIIDEVEKLSSIVNPVRNVNDALDIKYSQLQTIHKWFIVSPAMIIQGKSYSNIEMRTTNYTTMQK